MLAATAVAIRIRRMGTYDDDRFTKRVRETQLRKRTVRSEVIDPSKNKIGPSDSIGA